jgi:hypothetical protein
MSARVEYILLPGDASLLGGLPLRVVSSSFELLRLRKQVDELETELRRVRTTAPQGTENLAQGAEEFTIRYSLTFGLYPGERICQQPSRQLGTIFLQPSPL